MNEIKNNVFEEHPPTYTTLKVNGKERRVRRFGGCTLTDKYGNKKVIREAGYYFIKNEPKTIYTKDIHDCINMKKKRDTDAKV